MDDLSNTGIKVSIVIPLYNKEKYIAQTLRDILAQTFNELEIIVVDDHSTDKSVSVVENILRCHSYPYQIICSDVNLGVSGARNLGISRCRGDFVHFFDADDHMDKNFMAFMYDEIVNSGADLVFSGFGVGGKGSEKIRTYLPGKRIANQEDTRKIVLLNYLKGKRWLNASNVLYRKDLLERYKISFPLGCKFAEDREFILKALFHSGRVSFVDRVLCYYFQHSDQSTKKLSSDLSKYAYAVAVYRRLLHYFEEKGAEPFINTLIREFELPNSLIKMACSFAENQKRQLFEKLVNLPNFREELYPCWHAVFYKPEVAFKAFLALYRPYSLYRKYSRRQNS